MFCIPKYNIDKILSDIKSLSSDNQILNLVEMPSDERVKFFKKNLSDEGAKILNDSFEKAIESKRKNALSNWMKKNFDKKYREEMEVKQLSNRQKQVVYRYINERSKNKISDIKKIDEIVAMDDSERLELLKKLFGDDEKLNINEKIKLRIASDAKKLNDEIEKKASKVVDVSMYGKIFTDEQALDKFIESKAQTFAEKKLGVALTSEEVEKFSVLGKNLYQAAKELGSEGIDLINKKEESYKFGMAHKEIEEFTNSLLPVSFADDLINRIGKSNMLLSIKSPFLNILSNTEGGFFEAIARRASNWKFFGNVDKKVRTDYVKESRKFFKKTGLDVTRMITVEGDYVAGIGKVAGEKTGTGSFMKSYSDFIFNKLMTTPDVFFSSFAFADSANIMASKIAKGNSAKATEIFTDAARLSPKTETGRMVREIAIMDARKATYTNDSFSSKVTMAIREALNTIPGVGDIIMPFVKTVANVAELSADYAGLGLVKSAGKGVMLGTSLVKGRSIDKELMRGAFADIARSGLGLTAAYAIASQLNPDDFMGAYDPARNKIDQLSNAAFNAIRVKTPFGEKWISVDYFGVLSTSIVGFMYAKKYGKESPLYQYALGAGWKTLQSMPVNLQDIDSAFPDIDPENPGKTLENVKKFGTGYIADVVAARMIPGISSDIAKSLDEYQRDTSQKKHTLFGINFDKFINKVPYLSEKTLPIKHDAFGRVMTEESAFESLMFGSRVKTARMDNIVKEVYRLRNADQQPNIKDLRFMNSTKVDELKEKTGDKFIDIAIKYGQDLAREYEKEMNRTNSVWVGEKRFKPYRELDDEEKKARLDRVGQVLYEKTLKANGVKYRQ